MNVNHFSVQEFSGNTAVSNTLIGPQSGRRRHRFLKVPETLVEFGCYGIKVKPLIRTIKGPPTANQ
jgi:hypothetical protein